MRGSEFVRGPGCDFGAGVEAEGEGGAGGESLVGGVAGGQAEAIGLCVEGLKREDEECSEHTLIYRIV